MSTDKLHSIRGLIVRTVCVVFGLLALYAASLGPVTFFYYRKFALSNASDALAVQNEIARGGRYFWVYKPLFAATYRTPLEQPLQSYIGWWERLGFSFNSEQQ